LNPQDTESDASKDALIKTLKLRLKKVQLIAVKKKTEVGQFKRLLVNGTYTKSFPKSGL